MLLILQFISFLQYFFQLNDLIVLLSHQHLHALRLLLPHKKFDLHLLYCYLVEVGKLGHFFFVELAARKIFGFIVVEEQGFGIFPFLLDFLKQSPQFANLFVFLRILLEKLIIFLLNNFQFLLQTHKLVLQLDHFTHHGRITRIQ